MAAGIGRAGWAKKGAPRRRPGAASAPVPQLARGPRPAPPTPRLAPATTTAAEMLARVLVQTDTVLIIDKPQGLPVHGGPKGHESLESWLPHLQQGKRHLPQPAHRLDADTAGCLVLGRTKPALAELGALFAGREVKKTYWAVVRGVPFSDEGLIDAPLRKTSTAKTGWRMEIHPEGQPAVTRWRVLGRGEGMAWLELSPETGRTHQLRVHCAAQGWPILGDALYGGGTGPLHLLARAIALPLTPPLAATAEPPEAMRPALAACGWSGPATA